jgi:tRNA dimethylallyltransferase
VDLCEALGGEVVTADSRQVYRFMDIGTDKPSPQARRGIPHHMIDLADPDEAYTLAMFQDGAYAAIEQIMGRGKVPVLAGGTPLYLLSVIEGWEIPRVEPDMYLRRTLEAEAERIGTAALHERLAGLDSAAAAKILPTNTRRIIRALEVILSTGRPISEQQAKRPPPYNVISIGLTCERGELFRRIDARVDSQFVRGLVEEVASLHARGYAFDLPSMSGLGYRQVGDYLLGRATLDEARQRIKWDTHAFVRHQVNWFSRLTGATLIDVTHTSPTPGALEVAKEILG